MSSKSFFDIEFENPPPELELSVEMRCREVMNSDNFDDVKRYCTHLIRHQMKQDIFLAGMLGRLAELEALNVIKEMREEKLRKKKTIGRQIKKIFRIP
mgnify:FL=1|tara:strand:- start:336 stop:629 length:294 start_codon:yes stop_codon:yes gene_type:complete